MPSSSAVLYISTGNALRSGSWLMFVGLMGCFLALIRLSYKHELAPLTVSSVVIIAYVFF